VLQQILSRTTRFYTYFSIYEQIFYPIPSRLTHKSLARFLERATINYWDQLSYSQFMKFKALIFAVYEACARPFVARLSVQDSTSRPSKLKRKREMSADIAESNSVLPRLRGKRKVKEKEVVDRNTGRNPSDSPSSIRTPCPRG
jgi:hypothetical protein